MKWILISGLFDLNQLIRQLIKFDELIEDIQSLQQIN